MLSDDLADNVRAKLQARPSSRNGRAGRRASGGQGAGDPELHRHRLDRRPANARTRYRAEYGLTGKRVVTYAGNVGLSQALDLVLAAADRAAPRARHRVRDQRRGSGPAGPASGARQGMDNVHFVDMQPKWRLPEVLAAGDVHVVPLKRGLARSSVPSKLYSVLAAGRPDRGQRRSRAPRWPAPSSGPAPAMAVPPDDAEAFTKAIAAPARPSRRGGGDGSGRAGVRRVLGLAGGGGHGPTRPCSTSSVRVEVRVAGRFSASWARHRRRRRWRAPARAAEPTRPSRRRWLWPLGLVLILVVGGVVIVQARRDSNPVPTPQIANEDTTTTVALAQHGGHGSGHARRHGHHRSHRVDRHHRRRVHHDHDRDVDHHGQTVRAVILVGGFGTRLRPLTAHTPKQMLPVVDRPMIERVVAGAGRLRRHRRGALARLPARRVPRGVSRRLVCGCRAALRGRARTARHRRRGPVRRARRRHRAHLPRLQRRRAQRSRRRRALGVPPAVGRRGHDRAHAGRRPVALRRRADRRRRSGRGVRREAAAPARRPPTGSTPVPTCSSRRCSTASRRAGRVSIERATFPEMVADGSLFALHSDAYWIDAGTPAHLPAGPARPDRRSPWPARTRGGGVRRGRRAARSSSTRS